MGHRGVQARGTTSIRTASARLGELDSTFRGSRSVFGAFLVFTGHRMFIHRNEDVDPSRSLVLRPFRRVVRTTDAYDGRRFWTRVDGRLVATPLLSVLALVGTTDIVFAVDSIPAIFAVTREPFLVFTRIPSRSRGCEPCTSCWPT